MQIYSNKRKCCIRKEFNSHRTVLGHQHGRRFIVLGHQHGRRFIVWNTNVAAVTSHTISQHLKFKVKIQTTLIKKLQLLLKALYLAE